MGSWDTPFLPGLFLISFLFWLITEQFNYLSIAPDLQYPPTIYLLVQKKKGKIKQGRTLYISGKVILDTFPTQHSTFLPGINLDEQKLFPRYTLFCHQTLPQKQTHPESVKKERKKQSKRLPLTIYNQVPCEKFLFSPYRRTYIKKILPILA